jgi:sigma-B regulation protein RsbU (phosphoserine phosphatase)
MNNTVNILIADDDMALCAYLQNVLKQLGHEPIIAHDGVIAWYYLQKYKIDLLITDWLMPGLSGVNLCQKIRQGCSGNPYIYTILLTGKSSSDDLIDAYKMGIDDFISKPVSSKELYVRIQAGLRVLNLEKELISKNQKLEQANQQIEKNYNRIKTELNLAAQMQRKLLSNDNSVHLPVNISSLYLPAEYLGGDLYGFYQLDDEHLGIYSIDIAGHGVTSAMLSVYLKKLLQPIKNNDSTIYKKNRITGKYNLRSPASIVELLNKKYYQDDGDFLYFTMVFALINTTTGEGQLCQAGHPYPLLYSNDKTTHLGNGGYPVGLIKDAEYENYHFNLNKGDKIFIFSDGIIECADKNDEQFGLNRVKECINRSKLMSLVDINNNLIHSLKSWQTNDSELFDDDISLVSIELK